MAFQSILLPTDFSTGAAAALAHGVTLASRSGATVRLLHVHLLGGTAPAPPGGNPDSTELRKRLIRHGRRALDILDAAGDRPTLEADIRHAGAAAPAIVRYARQHNVDLIVMGTHGRRGFRRFLLGSVAEEVLRLAPCPVWTVPVSTDPLAVPVLDPIVVPFDGSDDAQGALRVAADLARVFNGTLSVVQVITPPIEPNLGVPVYGWGPANAQAIERATHAVEAHVEPLRSAGLEITVTVILGYAALGILEHAEAIGARLIVIGSHGLTGVRRFLLGSTAARVVRGSSCPVLTLRRPSLDNSDGPDELATTRSGGDTSDAPS